MQGFRVEVWSSEGYGCRASSLEIGTKICTGYNLGLQGPDFQRKVAHGLALYIHEVLDLQMLDGALKSELQRLKHCSMYATTRISLSVFLKSWLEVARPPQPAEWFSVKAPTSNSFHVFMPWPARQVSKITRLLGAFILGNPGNPKAKPSFLRHALHASISVPATGPLGVAL